MHLHLSVNTVTRNEHCLPVDRAFEEFAAAIRSFELHCQQMPEPLPLPRSQDSAIAQLGKGFAGARSRSGTLSLRVMQASRMDAVAKAVKESPKNRRQIGRPNADLGHLAGIVKAHSGI
jgi:hypothetical protein